MKTAALGSALVSLACLFSITAFAAPPTSRDAAKITPDMIQTASDIRETGTEEVKRP
ncbi:hypothetical protein R2APBS1_2540 [Rhodanobacter denitrificans]|uniref:Uncharacterized protein n=2 Tax=Rhodanobacter denitrificans TaxID=666685 RepID=M4NPQ8_9GAMM|nr:hypothetical protein R2APBS1_2540 [Rhodanobacter denitrificans]